MYEVLIESRVGLSRVGRLLGTEEKGPKLVGVGTQSGLGYTRLRVPLTVVARTRQPTLRATPQVPLYPRDSDNPTPTTSRSRIIFLDQPWISGLKGAKERTKMSVTLRRLATSGNGRVVPGNVPWTGDEIGRKTQREK